MATKAAVLEKMNRRHGTQHPDYFMLCVWLKREAARLKRKAERAPELYQEQAEWLAVDYNEALNAE